jgi:hypothetical protein
LNHQAWCIVSDAIQKKAANMERERQEEGLRQLAQQARAERAGIKVAPEELEEVCTCVQWCSVSQ